MEVSKVDSFEVRFWPADLIERILKKRTHMLYHRVDIQYIYREWNTFYKITFTGVDLNFREVK